MRQDHHLMRSRDPLGWLKGSEERLELEKANMSKKANFLVFRVESAEEQIFILQINVV